MRARAIRTAAILLAAAASGTLLSGCAFSRRIVPTDPSGMEFPLGYAGRTVAQQVRTSGTFFERLPGFLVRHTRDCWDNLSHDW